MILYDLSGTWQAAAEGVSFQAELPGTLDQNGFGPPDDVRRQWKLEDVKKIGFWQEGDPIVTRLTRRHAYEGEVCFSRKFSWPRPDGMRVFAEVERARQLSLEVNGRPARSVSPLCLSAPVVFEITDQCTGEDILSFRSDNRYAGWPREAILYSSAASDETQTNWNGLLGFLRLRVEKPVFFSALRVYPHAGTLDAVVEIDAGQSWEGRVRLESSALPDTAEQSVRLSRGTHRILFQNLPVSPDAARWDLEAGNLQTVKVSAPGLEDRTVSFGLRTFEAENGRLTLNGRKIFLRGEANCAVFPETGFCPTDTAAWRKALGRYRSYGINCVRFHSHCPPEAAFIAADEAGMLLQPELSHWDPAHAFESEEARRYYRREVLAILSALANHPSFVMLSFGNELQAEGRGRAFMDVLLGDCRAEDPTRLYAIGSNAFYGEQGPDAESDFYTSGNVREKMLRATSAGPSGWLNGDLNRVSADYDDALALLRKQSRVPVISFEVGQYETLPDFDGLRDWRGVTDPANLRHMRNRAEQAGQAADWKRRVEATGELALLCYRAEAEAAMATGDLSGISLLGLQDFPGQGTALVGMMDAWLNPKPYSFARPERFRAFFRDTLPIAMLPRRTWTDGESFHTPVRIAHSGKETVSAPLRWRAEGRAFLAGGEIPLPPLPPGTVYRAGEIRFPLNGFSVPERIDLILTFGDAENRYSLWVYPDIQAASCPPSVLECRELDQRALDTLARGGRVYLSPDRLPEDRAVKGQFSTDFWSACTFPQQAGAMGLMIQENHPALRGFPTSFHTDWQWRPMASGQAVILPRPMEAIVAQLDSCCFLRPMAMLLECRCGGGRLLLSTMALHRLAADPGARALQQSLYDYLASEEFQPAQELTPAEIRDMTGTARGG